MIDISQIFFSSSRFTIDKRSSDSDTLPILKENDIVEAKVLKLLSGRSAQLMILDRSVTVKTHVPLKEGEIINLRVESSGDMQILKLVEKQDPAQQLNKALADNLDRAGPYKNLLKLFDSIKTPEKIVNQGFLKGENIAPEKVEMPKMLDKVLNTILTQSTPDERSQIATFINTKTISFKDKLTELISSKEGKTVLTRLTEKNVFLKEILNKIVQTFPETKPPIKVEFDSQVAGNRFPSKELKSQEWPKEVTVKNSTPINEKGSPPVNFPDRQIMKEFVQSKTVRWTHKLLAVLSANKENLARHDGVMKHVEKVIEILLDEFDRFDPVKDTLKKDFFPSMNENRIRPAAIKNQPLNQVKLMTDLLTSMSLKSGDPETDLVRNFVLKSGMTWENKISFMIQSGNPVTLQKLKDMAVKDLKGLALSVLASTDEADESVGTALKNFVDSLEHLQLINRYSSEESGKYLLPFPVMFNDSLKFGQLLIDLGKEDSTDRSLKNRVVKVAFILELSNLSDLRADFSIFGKSVTGVFGVGSREFRAVIKREIPGLEKRLNGLGYKVYGIDCQLIDTEILSNTTLTNQVMKTETDGVLNLVI